MKHKSGFVSIVGNPNVGKSTISNMLTGERLSIVTSKAQTTRHKILGIVNDENHQIVFTDTPGVLKPNYKLQEAMLKYSKSALEEADIITYITDTVETPGKNEDFLTEIKKSKVPVILVINKIDLSSHQEIEKLIETWKMLLPNSEIFPISALHKFNLDKLYERIAELIPEAPPFFDKTALTDKPEKFFISEIIREKILLYYKQEIPYSVEVEIEEYKEGQNITEISAIIHVARESQKGILIGQKGKALKKLGTESRRTIQNFLEKKVHLNLFVKVSKNWRDTNNSLLNFGYK
ncbi:GTPase Era [Marinilabiliaceae bacterium ANBcel2]|nr:GTPase Era [Marinilabiliaceae bacterium ANBcel2]